MKKVLASLIGISLIFFPGVSPAQAQACSTDDTASVRALLIPITRISAQQGRNTSENRQVISSIRQIAESTSSARIRNSLEDLRVLVIRGEIHTGSTLYWGYKAGSVWKTYKKVLVLTQRNTC